MITTFAMIMAVNFFLIKDVSPYCYFISGQVTSAAPCRSQENKEVW
jgi:hypothetical protein